MRSIMKCSTALFFLASFAMVSFHATPGQAQLRNLPRVSPAASVAQRIGITDITIDYHRPGVKDRVSQSSERTIWLRWQKTRRACDIGRVADGCLLPEL